MAGSRSIHRRIVGILALLVANVVVILAVGVGAFVYVWTAVAGGLPDLHGWHLESPASEFVASDAIEGYDFDDYLAQETRVFEELAELVTGHWSTDRAGGLCRFRTDSVCNPATILERNWNRTFVIDHPSPIGGALLIHGLSDSPYSLRAMGQRLHAEGFTVIGLRVPGHGTCPHALSEAELEDWIAAVRIAARGVRERVPDNAPLVVVGFSNGGALSVDYAISAVEEPDLPQVDAVVLFSPMIGIMPAAKLSRLYTQVMRLSGQEKVGWQSINAEIDPFKYSSWPMNASVQAWGMTRRVERRLGELERAGRLREMPPILAVQSAVDSTVVVSNLITALFDRLDCDESELLLFDVNRSAWVEDLLDLSFEHRVIPALQNSGLRFRLSLVTNETNESDGLVIRTRDGNSLEERAIGARWPTGLFSLSHGAMPIPATDPVLGSAEATQVTGLPLGSLAARGESGVLAFSEQLLVRLRYNPFYEFTEDYVVDWLSSSLAADRPEAEAD
jgi:alpha-beta hydrolase superfamily lysophospholipase